VGENPADGAVISYFLRTRQVIGKLSLEILDSSGAVVDSIATGKRKGLNRVVWSMRTKPPLVPPAAQIAGASLQGPRVLPGSYTVRLTRAGKVYSMPLAVALDRRATYSIADRTAQFDAANRVKRLFGRMTALTGQIAVFRAQAAEIGAKLPPGDPLGTQLAGFADHADSLRKLVVATKEGGAITGEVRLREKTDDVYGAIISTEGSPTPSALARVDVLDHELSDVEQRFAALTKGDLPALNEKLKARSLPPLTLAAIVPVENIARGGSLDALFGGIVGSRLRTSATTAARQAGADR
jgi:hypothetical protein